MNFFKIIFITLYFLFAAFSAQADNHDKEQISEQNIIEKAKEINLKVKEKQALQNIGKEELKRPICRRWIIGRWFGNKSSCGV